MIKHMDDPGTFCSYDVKRRQDFWVLLVLWLVTDATPFRKEKSFAEFYCSINIDSMLCTM